SGAATPGGSARARSASPRAPASSALPSSRTTAARCAARCASCTGRRRRPYGGTTRASRAGLAPSATRGCARLPHPGRGRRAHPRVAEGARPAREARVVPPYGRRLRPVQDAHRAAHLAAVVLLDGRAEEAGARGDALRARALPPGVAAPLRDRVARDGARLEHLAPDLVGPPAAVVGMPR